MNFLKTKIITSALAISAISLLLAGSVAMGQVPPVTPPSPVTSITTVGGLVALLEAILRWIYIIFFIIAVIFILVSAYSYVTAGGDAEKLTKAKNYLIYAVIGIVVALLAYGVTGIIRSFLIAPTT